MRKHMHKTRWGKRETLSGAILVIYDIWGFTKVLRDFLLI